MTQPYRDTAPPVVKRESPWLRAAFVIFLIAPPIVVWIDASRFAFAALPLASEVVYVFVASVVWFVLSEKADRKHLRMALVAATWWPIVVPIWSIIGIVKLTRLGLRALWFWVRNGDTP
jgi:hypothetical protein